MRTRETELRRDMQEREFDAVVLVEGSGRPKLEARIKEPEAVISASGCGLIRPQSIVDDLAYQLDKV